MNPFFGPYFSPYTLMPLQMYENIFIFRVLPTPKTNNVTVGIFTAVQLEIVNPHSTRHRLPSQPLRTR